MGEDMMTFYGSDKMYKRMLFLGIPLTLIIFFIAFITQGKEFSFVHVMLFAIAGGTAAGLIGIPVIYMLGGEKKIVLTNDELRVEEGKRPKVVKYTDIRNIQSNGKQIQIILHKRKVLINNIHGYPIQEIYNQLYENWKKKESNVKQS